MNEPFPTNTISVQGTGVVVTEPDEAVVALAVVAQAPNAAAALSGTRTGAEQVRQRLEALGVASRDVRAGEFFLQQVMAYDGPTPRATGFESRIGFTVLLRDISRVDEVLAELVESGVSVLNNVTFGSSRAEEHADVARFNAVADARRRADLLAAAAGRSVGRALRIEEVSDAMGFAGGGMRMMAAEAASAPGGVELTAAVALTFELV